jgi:hypothetical protein
VQGKVCPGPTENRLANFTPLSVRRNFRDNVACSIAVRILQRNMQITIGFSAFTTQRGPVSANQFSIQERSDSHAKCTLYQKFWLQ